MKAICNHCDWTIEGESHDFLSKIEAQAISHLRACASIAEVTIITPIELVGYTKERDTGAVYSHSLSKGRVFKTFI